MNQGIIASRYGKALFGFAKDRGKEDAVYAEAENVIAGFMAERQMYRVLANPLVKASAKVGLLKAAAGGKVSAEMSDFLDLLVARGRELLLPEICTVYVELYNEQKRRLDMELVSAVPLGGTELEKVRKKAEELTGYNVTLRSEVDPALIGGFVMRWDTYRLDASIAGSLKRLRKQFGLPQSGNL